MSDLKDLMLSRPRLTLAVAESVTCGRLQARIGADSGASEYFLGGLTAYSLEQKVRHLGVDRAGAEGVNSVSAGVAEQMARGACALFGACSCLRMMAFVPGVSTIVICRKNGAG